MACERTDGRCRAMEIDTQGRLNTMSVEQQKRVEKPHGAKARPIRKKGPVARRRVKKTTRKRPPEPTGESERIATRRSLALTARAAGASYRQIAEQLQVSVGTAHEDVVAELQVVSEASRQTAAELRDLELSRIDRIIGALDAKVAEGDATACRVVLKASDQRSRILGLYREAKDHQVDQAEDYLAFLTQVWEKRRAGVLVIDIPTDETEKPEE